MKSQVRAVWLQLLLFFCRWLSSRCQGGRCSGGSWGGGGGLLVDAVDLPKGNWAVVGLDALVSRGNSVVVVPFVGVDVQTALAVQLCMV